MRELSVDHLARYFLLLCALVGSTWVDSTPLLARGDMCRGYLRLVPPGTPQPEFSTAHLPAWTKTHGIDKMLPDLLKQYDKYEEKWTTGKDVPSTIQVGKYSYKVAKYLGSGNESKAVYLAQGPHGVCVIKCFKNPRGVAFNVETMRKLKAAGIDVAPVEEVDSERGNVVLSYVEGVELSWLLNTNHLSEAQRQDVNNAFEAFEKKYSQQLKSLGLNITPGSVYLDIHTGKIVIVDPF